MGQGTMIGYEINEKSCQISYYNDQQSEPETLEVDTDHYQIPLLIGNETSGYSKGRVCCDQASGEKSGGREDRFWGGKL